MLESSINSPFSSIFGLHLLPRGICVSSAAECCTVSASQSLPESVCWAGFTNTHHRAEENCFRHPEVARTRTFMVICIKASWRGSSIGLGLERFSRNESDWKRRPQADSEHAEGGWHIPSGRGMSRIPLEEKKNVGATDVWWSQHWKSIKLQTERRRKQCACYFDESTGCHFSKLWAPTTLFHRL